jgi:DNA-binding transcriptional LysR family regulator
MNARQVEVFKAIMECGSITAAARVLHVSQPAVTKALQLLEHDIGLRLFERTPKGLVPTFEARAFYTEVERTFTGLSYLKTFAQELSSLRHARLVVSVIPALSDRWLPRVASRFLADYPEVSLSFQAASSPHTAQLVGQGQVDLGIAQSRVDDPSMERTLLSTLRAVCIMPEDHALAAEEVIHPEHLRGQTLVSLSRQDIIRLQVEQVLEAAAVTVSRPIEVSLGITLRELVALGFGIGIVDSGSAEHPGTTGIVTRPFEPRIDMPIYLLRRRARTPSLIEQRFVDYLRKYPP